MASEPIIQPEVPQDTWHTNTSVVIPRDTVFSDADRQWWAFQPLSKSHPPQLPPEHRDWTRTGVDTFITAKLNKIGLKPTPEADRSTLLRRLSFDLTGLPPSPEDIQQFVADPTPDAYEKWVDRLLNSPQYGERQARFWLDLVRYAESDGYRVDDYRPDVWRYRDWVIQAWNDDMPYDEFLQAQIAGDELWPNDPQRARVATSFLRHWIYEYNNRDVRGQWETILNDLTDVAGDVFMGMGIQCARCHDHKFDPILQKDYFRLRAFFAPILPREDLVVATEGERAAYEAQLSVWQRATIDLRDELEELEAPYRAAAGETAMEKFTEDLQDLILKPLSERSPLEHQIAELAYRQVTYEHRRMAGRIKGEEKERRDELIKRLQAFDSLKPKPLPPSYTVTDVGREAPQVLMTGRQGTVEVEPGFLSILDEEPAAILSIPELRTTGRRATLAKWLTQPDNPLTARVIVNRIWQRHFGQGLVATPSDFGRLGEPPSHPELLDWLTQQFINQGWRIKPLHRVILLSATYRQGTFLQTSDTTIIAKPWQEGQRMDPLNRLLWHYPTRRLDAEQIRDNLLAVTGELDLTIGGPAVPSAQPRRSIYTRATRNVRDPLLDAFDGAESFVSSSERNVTTTPTQSLLMINSQTLLARAQAFADRLLAIPDIETLDDIRTASESSNRSESGVGFVPTSELDIDADPNVVFPETSQRSLTQSHYPRIQHAYLLVFGRPPHPDELAMASHFLNDQRNRLPTQTNPRPALLSERMPYQGSHAAVFRPGSRQDHFKVPFNGAEHLLKNEDGYTIESFVLLRRAPDAHGIRVVASMEPTESSPEQWLLGVAGAQVAGQSLTVVLQLGTSSQRQLISSGLILELNRPYYIGVTVSDQVVFTVKDAANDCEPALVVPARFKPSKFTAKSSVVPESDGESLVIHSEGEEASDSTGSTLFMGRSTAAQTQPWDGLIAEVRLSAAPLAPSQLLLADNREVPSKCVGWWRFDPNDDPFQDASPANHPIECPPMPPDDRLSPEKQAWVDFCHVLLNSNEFLYVD
jgi:hypothetical protein